MGRATTVLDKELFVMPQFPKKNCSVETVPKKELFCGNSSRKRTVSWKQFSKKNCWEDMVPEKELLGGYGSQKGTVMWRQFPKKNYVLGTVP